MGGKRERGDAIIGSLQIMNTNGNIDTNVRFLLKTSHAALILNSNFTFVFMFPFMFVIRKLPNVFNVEHPMENLKI